MNTNFSNSILTLQANAALVGNPKIWMDSQAIDQLIATASLPYMKRVVGMPDLHPGRTYPIGAAFFSTDHIYPALIGSDIGCGMGIWQTDLLVRKFHTAKAVDKLNRLESILTPTDINTLISGNNSATHIYEMLVNQQVDLHGLGTIGQGNHFVELQKVEAIMNPTIFESFGLSADYVHLLVHSGSRGLGDTILRQHITQHGFTGLSVRDEAFQQYWQQHDLAMDYANLNRQLIAQRFCQRLNTQGDRILDLFHNFLVETTINGQTGFLHRKGATPSDQGLVVIPGSRGDYSYLVLPKADEIALNSLAHGAGRRWKRSHCKENIKKRYHISELSKTKLGNHVICKDRQLIYEEAPEAYKPITPIIDALVSAGLIEVVAKLCPLITFKTNGECC